MQNSKRAMPVILIAIFLDLVTNGILVTIVPQLLGNPDSPYYMLPLGVPVSYAYILLGFLIAAFPVFMFFSAPILGEYSDYVGRRKVMTLSLAGSGIALILFAFGVTWKSLTMLFIARIIGGIMSGNLSVAQAAIADITPPEKRAAQFGLIGAAYGVGFIVGPVIGALLSDPSVISWFNASTPFWFAAILSIADAALVYVFMGETRKSTERVSVNWSKAVSNIIHGYNMKRIRGVFATNFFFQSGLTIFGTFFAVFLASSFGWSQVSVGYYIGYIGIWVVISQAVLLPLLSKKYDEVTIMRVFLLVGACSFFLFYITEHTLSFLLAGAFIALTNGLAMAALPSLASRRAPEDRQGEILGINASVQALAQAIPPVAAGLLAAQITPAAPIYVAGAVIGVGWIVFMMTVKKER